MKSYFFSVLLIASILYPNNNKNRKGDLFINKDILQTNRGQANFNANYLEQLNDSGGCKFNTSGLPKSKGLNVEFYVPCNWERNDQNTDIPTLVTQFFYHTDPNYGFILSINISHPSDSDYNKMVNSRKLSNDVGQYVKDVGTILSSKRLVINGIITDEVTAENSFDNGRSGWSYSLMFMFYYKGNWIGLSYAVAAGIKSKAKSLFNLNKALFNKLGHETKIL